jgi:L-ascorbate metabolism protein UlaG (beta-lactamase superfamily)
MVDLPELDAVVISHDHYDHLALEEVRALIPRTKKFIVPLGVGAHLERWGVPSAKIVDLNWWEEAVIGNGVRVIATPARHFSGRGFRRDQTLWASVALIGPAHRVFFSGDSGMTPEFTEIGRRFGSFDCTLIKIGAYGRTWPDIHINPEQALEVHRMVRGKAFIPAHWATYNLAAHSWYEPADRLLAAVSGAGVTVIVPKPGQPVVPDDPPPLVRWWDALR